MATWVERSKMDPGYTPPSTSLMPGAAVVRRCPRCKAAQFGVSADDVTVTVHWELPPFRGSFTWHGRRWSFPRWTPWTARDAAQRHLQRMHDRDRAGIWMGTR